MYTRPIYAVLRVVHEDTHELLASLEGPHDEILAYAEEIYSKGTSYYIGYIYPDGAIHGVQDWRPGINHYLCDLIT